DRAGDGQAGAEQQVELTGVGDDDVRLQLDVLGALDPADLDVHQRPPELGDLDRDHPVVSEDLGDGRGAVCVETALLAVPVPVDGDVRVGGESDCHGAATPCPQRTA